MSSANTGFAYVFNMPLWDHMVARVLSGWAPDDLPLSVDQAKLDSAACSRLAQLRAHAFSACSGLSEASLNAETRVLETFAATVVLQYRR